MLKDLTDRVSIIHIAGREYGVKFSQDALLYLELFFIPFDELLTRTEWDKSEIVKLCRALMCSLTDNLGAVRLRDWGRVRPSSEELAELIEDRDMPLLSAEILRAALASLPTPEPSEETDRDKVSTVTTEGHLRALYVDVMGRPEEEFWQSTKRELLDRIDCYLEVRGMKEAPIRVKRYADE